MLERIGDRKFFFGLTIIFVCACITLLIMFPQGRSFFIINGMYHPVGDMFFTWFTYVGDGVAVAIIAFLLMVFYRVGAGVVSLLGLGLCGLTVSLLKTYVFIESPRPKLFFWGNKMVHYIDGLYINIEHSFPSGHSLTAFFCFTFLAMLRLGESVISQLVFATAAILAAYSRVYLAHHFVGDILAGALIGIAFGILMYYLYSRIRKQKWSSVSLISYLNRKRL